jgi:polyhydroxyalkanoate synthesis regulator phasin
MTIDYIFEMVDEMIDMEGDINIAGTTFSRSYILKKLDPIAYREVALGMIDSHLEDLRDDLDRLDPVEDADQVDFLNERIEELENF